MHRLACVDLLAFPLQLLLKQHDDWREFPVAVVAEEKPQAPLLWVNEKARRKGIRPGHRYAAGLALSSDLRAGAISASAVQEEVDELTRTLGRFTPDVEPAGAQWNSPGLFWLDASGLRHLYESLEQWGESIRQELERASYYSVVIVGFSRFGSYAVARASRKMKVFDSREEEAHWARRVPMSRLDLPPDAQESFLKLRVRNVGDFLKLPAKGLLKRFGSEVHALHRLASGDLYAPLMPHAPEEPLQEKAELPGPDTDSERLLFFIKQLLDALLKKLHARSLALTHLLMKLELDDHSTLEESLRPDAATLDGPRLIGLVRLRLETLRLRAGVVEVELTAKAKRITHEQLSLIVTNPRRDPKMRQRAFERLRAEFGEQVVVQARLANGHLPSARFQWVPFSAGASIRSVSSPSPKANDSKHLIRRIYEKPFALPPRSRREPDGWLLNGLEHGPVRDFLGPYVLSGGWWKRTVEREYYFVKMQQGSVFWIFYDRSRRRWFLQGRVE